MDDLAEAKAAYEAAKGTKTPWERIGSMAQESWVRAVRRKRVKEGKDNGINR